MGNRFISKAISKTIFAFNRKLAFKKIKKHSLLWEELSSYMDKSGSTGCEYSDYWVLYEYIRNKRPIHVGLEYQQSQSLVLCKRMKKNLAWLEK